jgi:nicotinate-nucleotide adenylyltransferase
MRARVGILGGSFDPIHRGHLRLAAALRERLGLDRVVLVPAALQPLKGGKAAAPPDDRLAMARLAADEVAREEAPSPPWLEVSDVELRRPGPSYTIDTLLALRAELGPEAELHFLAGADVLADLERWYRVDDLLAAARFVVASRPGHAIAVPARFRGRVSVEPIDALPISATDVRESLARGGVPGDLVPASVAEYIRARSLYRSA